MASNDDTDHVDNQSKLCNAIVEGNINEVRELLDKGLEVDAPLTDDDLRPLHIAAKNNQYEICELLLEKGADVNISERNTGWTPLLYASYHQVAPCVMELLLRNGASANVRNHLNTTPLHQILYTRYNPEKLHLLMNAGVKDSLNVETISAMTPLMIAVKLHEDFNHVLEGSTPPCQEVVEQLIKGGADVRYRNTKQRNVLHKACTVGCYSVVKLLLNEGCDVNQFDDEGNSPLHILVDRANRKIPEHAHDKSNPWPFVMFAEMMEGDDDNRYGKTLDDSEKEKIRHYHEEGVLDAIKQLKVCGADINLTNTVGETALHLACLMPCYHIKNILIELGADVNSLNTIDRKMPLHVLCSRVEKSTQEKCNGDLMLLMENGADVHGMSLRIWTPLHYATYFQYMSAIETLIKHGADIEARDICGMTPLHLAATSTDTSILLTLLSHGADIEAQDIYGATPAYYAIEWNVYNLVALLKNGANIRAKDNYGHTLWDNAKFHESEIVLQALDTYVSSGPNGLDSILKKDDENGQKGDPGEDESPSRSEYVEEWGDRVCDLYEQGRRVPTLPLVVDDTLLKKEDVPAWLEKREWEEKVNGYISHFISQPVIVETDECRLMTQQMMVLMQRLAEAVAEADPRLDYTPILSGSLSEGTKVTHPDEFDFLLCLNKVSQEIDVLEYGDNPASYCQVMHKAEYNESRMAEFFDKDRMLTISHVSPILYSTICKCLTRPEVWEGLGFYWSSGPHHDARFISSLQVVWVGPMLKWLSVSVDLVPAISMPRWWPDTARQDCKLVTEDMRTEGCLIVMKPSESAGGDDSYMRISFSKAETDIFRNESDTVRKAYMLAKSIRHICPKLHLYDGFEDSEVDAEFLFSSYALKTCLFKELEAQKSEPYDKNDLDVQSLAYHVWHRLELAVQDGSLSSYFIEDYKVGEEIPMGDADQYGYPKEHAKALCQIVAAFLKPSR